MLVVSPLLRSGVVATDCDGLGVGSNHQRRERNFPLLRSGVFGAEWEGLGVGGAHQQQKCGQTDSWGNGCSQATLHNAVPNN